jgi:nucleotide-binding universal stress UspA family protein
MDILVEQKFSKILFGVDGSKESMDAVNFAIGLAKKDNANLVSFTVMQLPSFCGWSAIESPKEWQEKDRAEIEQWKEKIRETAKENNVQIEMKAVESPMSVEGAIVDYADKENIDLIVVGTRGRTGFSKKLLGSVALGVVTHASCPVTVVK